jgi:hypothetical protein
MAIVGDVRMAKSSPHRMGAKKSDGFIPSLLSSGNGFLSQYLKRITDLNTTNTLRKTTNLPYRNWYLERWPS